MTFPASWGLVSLDLLIEGQLSSRSQIMDVGVRLETSTMSCSLSSVELIIVRRTHEFPFCVLESDNTLSSLALLHV